MTYVRTPDTGGSSSAVAREVLGSLHLGMVQTRRFEEAAARGGHQARGRERTVERSREAAPQLSADGMEAEVVDLRTLVPLLATCPTCLTVRRPAWRQPHG
jgi:hypothetical protein